MSRFQAAYKTSTQSLSLFLMYTEKKFIFNHNEALILQNKTNLFLIYKKIHLIYFWFNKPYIK